MKILAVLVLVLWAVCLVSAGTNPAGVHGYLPLAAVIASVVLAVVTLV